MEKKFFAIDGSAKERATHAALTAVLNEKLSEWHGYIYEGTGKDRDGYSCACMVIEFPCVHKQYAQILAAREQTKEPDTLPALVKKIKTRLWDDQACEAFGELIELLDNRLKELEKK